MDRFLRIERLLGAEAVRRLQGAMITVVGLGAVGGYAVEGLARSGVGRLRVVDFDRVRTHNINRQIIALEDTIGAKKCDAIKSRVLRINPACKVEALDIFADKSSAPEILTPAPHILIDAIDSLNPKFELLKEAHARGIYTISSMGAALRTDPSLIRTADIMATERCPLARRLRKKLRKSGIKGGIPCVYSREEVNFDYQAPESAPEEDDVPEANRGRPRRVLGSLPTITAIFGLTIANLAIARLGQEHGDYT